MLSQYEPRSRIKADFIPRSSINQQVCYLAHLLQPFCVCLADVHRYIHRETEDRLDSTHRTTGIIEPKKLRPRRDSDVALELEITGQKRLRSKMDSVSPSSGTHLSANTNSSERSYRIPKISRKVHACTECQARKIKCDVNPPEHSICTRCSKKKMRCVVNKSLQSLLGEGTE